MPFLSKRGSWLVVVAALGTLTCIGVHRGDEATALRLIDALERHHQATGRYPESLDALAPAYMPALPTPQPGHTDLPYYYVRRETGYELSYRVHFKAYRVYHSPSKSWKDVD